MVKAAFVAELPEILTEDVITLKQAACLLRVNRVSIGRYVRDGRPVKGRAVRLEGVMVGGRWKTSREAVARFLEAIQPPCVKADDRTARNSMIRRGEKAAEALRKAGILK